MDSIFVKSQDEIQLAQAKYITKVYSWMTLGLLITAFAAYVVAATPALINLIYGNKAVFYIILFAPLAVVWFLSARIHKISANMAIGAFVFYALINGLTLSFIFTVYSIGSVFTTFVVTAGTFAAMSAYGYYTKQDLTKLGNMLKMALIGLIIATVVNWFWANSVLYWISTYAGVLIFVGLTAYDTQKIKEMYTAAEYGVEVEQKSAIMGALSLYLDFLNLFLFLLRIFGGSRD
jgi:uncharacterized protein